MPVAGIDIGAGTAKAVILENDEIIASSVIPVGGNITLAIDSVINNVLDEAGISLSSLENVVSTGYGRDAVPFASAKMTEIICHASGVHFLIPHARTIIDIGAQDSKVIRINDEGIVVNFMMNDKCAAGTGRFLEVMAQVLGIEIGKMGDISLAAQDLCSISSICTVFAETEVVSLRAQGRAIEDLVAGIHRAVASRVITMGTGLHLENETVFTGGVAKNTGVKVALEEAGKIKCIIPPAPQITGALGAALNAQNALDANRVR
jgi:predicted CoA-substrate-specific enzyme activase